MKFVHATIHVRDMEKSLNFYQGIVGLAIVKRFVTGPDTEIVFLGEGDTLVELISSGESEIAQVGSGISLGFGVESLDETMDFIEGRGIEIHSGPFEPNPVTRFFYVLDPNGLKIQFIEQK